VKYALIFAMDRDQKIQWLKDVQAGKVKVYDIIPHKLDLVLNYPGLAEDAYYFIDKKRISSEEYSKSLDRQLQVFDKVFAEVHIGSGGIAGYHINPDPLPDYCKLYVKTQSI
jgi:hypothetical protein